MNRTNQFSLSILCFFICFLLAMSGIRARDEALAADIAQQSGAQCEALDDLNTPVLVTTRDVDQQTADAARVIGYGINLFLHPSLDIADMELFLS